MTEDKMMNEVNCYTQEELTCDILKEGGMLKIFYGKYSSDMYFKIGEK
jgi:hypothetical protein